MEFQNHDEKRKHSRVQVDLAVQAKVGETEDLDVDIVDISAKGMQIRCQDIDVLRKGFDFEQNVATFEIKIQARLAWARPEPDGSYVTGWEFNRGDEEQRIG